MLLLPRAAADVEKNCRRERSALSKVAKPLLNINLERDLYLKLMKMIKNGKIK